MSLDLEPWQGMGLRGNESSPVRFKGTVPEVYRIGPEHSAMRDAAGIFPPVLGATYAAAYIGIGSGALDLALAEGARKGMWSADFAAAHAFKGDPVIVEPDVTEVRFEAGDEFLLMATDGL